MNSIKTIYETISSILADEGTIPSRPIDFKPNQIVKYCPLHKIKLKKSRGTAEDLIKGKKVLTEIAFCPHQNCDYMVKRKPTKLPYDT